MRRGEGTRAPGGGTPCPGVGRPGSGALPPPTTRPFGRAAGANYPLAVGAGDAGVGALARPLGALCGRHEGGGGAPCLGVWRPGSGALPAPATRAFGRSAGAHYRRADLSPAALRALLRAGFAHCGGGWRVPGGGASCLRVERQGTGALPPPTSRPFRRAAGAHYPLAVGAGGAGVGTRHRPHRARTCELALRAVGAA